MYSMERVVLDCLQMALYAAGEVMDNADDYEKEDDFYSVTEAIKDTLRFAKSTYKKGEHNDF